MQRVPPHTFDLAGSGSGELVMVRGGSLIGEIGTLVTWRLAEREGKANPVLLTHVHFRVVDANCAMHGRTVGTWW